MKILNLLASGRTGGIEVLCQNILLKSKEDNRICCLFSEGEIYDNLKKAGKKVFSVADLNGNVVKIVKELEKYCQKEKMDVVIVHHGGLKCNIIYLMLMKRLKGTKFIRYLHGCFDNYSFGNDGNCIKRFLVKKVMSKALRKSDLIIYISDAVKRSFENVFNVKSKNNKVIYNGIPDTFFDRQLTENKEEQKNNDNNYIQISYVGRLAKLKGVDILIEAVSELQDEIKKIRLNIVGDGEEEKNLKKEVEELKIDKYVTFLGRKKDVIPILDKTDIFIYPSVCEEGLGISVIEAMARKCITIAFNKGGLPEIIDNNKNGIIVENVSSKDLSKAIRHIINMESNKKEETKENARQKAMKFNINNTINEIEKALIELK